MAVVDRDLVRYPFCVVWTPIPLLTWIFPFIGHMGIAYSTGVIRDFAGPYHVSVSSNGIAFARIHAVLQEDDMAFGKPTRYLQLDVDKVVGGAEAWDRGVREASEEYKVTPVPLLAVHDKGLTGMQGRMHNLLCDNCHSHVAMALNLMRYNDSSYNMVKLCFWSFFCAKYMGLRGFLVTWTPFVILVVTISLFATLL